MSYTVRNMLVALVLAAVGIFLLVTYVSQREREITKGQEFVEVLVAQKNIPAGTPADRLEADGFVALEEVRREDQVPNALSSLKNKDKEYIDKSTNATVYEGFQLSSANFATEAGLNPADQIKGTQRIMMVPLSPQGNIAEQIEPGSRIDILANIGFDIPDYSSGGNVSVPYTDTIVVCRDCLVTQTPSALKAAGGAGDEEAYTPPEVADDAQLYGLQVSDEVALQLLWAQENATDIGLIALLRPSNNANDTPLVPADALPPFVRTQVDAIIAELEKAQAQQGANQ